MIHPSISRLVHDRCRLVQEATNNDPCVPDAKTLACIADAAFDMDDCWRIAKVLHHRLGRAADWKQWRPVYKALVVLEFLTHGPEDLLVGKWLNIGGKGRNRYSLKPRMYDLNWFMDNFRPDTIAVHMLKDNRRWAAAFRYFNVTAGITPSDLYHLP